MQRGVCRSLRALGHSVVTELSLANGRRADVVALVSGRATSPSSRSNPACSTIRATANGTSICRICDRLYFAVSPDFPCEVIPDEAGLMLADRYGAELVREPVEERLSAARRKAMMLCFARAAALRLQLHLDPSCGFEV